MDAETLARRCVEAMWEEDRASQALGMQVIATGECRAEVSMTVREDMVNGHSMCHGGMIFTLADTAFAFACNSQNQAAVAASCTIDYLRPAQLGDVLTAVAEAVHQGGRSGLYDVIISNQEQAIVAHFRGRSARISRPVIEEESA
ncbi:hydroxyphenylacetyl-CoA thioesterase PaaI [Pseudomaricurvus alcaniphilus]|uniref:hydroxyphenylacetyl-CoA thioesterase PaaI n=1 Tax=Pseudomaricurvus alcaniphilus TaxID=1166482 RepID=UPI0014099BE6|nr:hydroxyphenylacetyl-CoA thioesterase PaaI [Pseudomaricurvus alcaniphilus]NHN36581.1 hydroxyphenylacetyl-CoA thioesterase PaaI [Pseudomaricurvus alcaniphilus]